MEDMVFGDPEPEGDPSHPLFEQLMIARSNRAQRSRAEYRSLFQPRVARCIPNLERSQRLASEVWARDLATLRILCLTEYHSQV